MDFIFNTSFISEHGDNMIDIIKSYEKMMSHFKKPLLFAEYGGHARGNDPISLEAYFHTGIWSQYMMPKMYSSVGFWWWAFIESKKLYSHYKALADFHLGEERVASQFDAIKIEISDPKLQGMGIMNPKVHYLWIYENIMKYTLSDLNTFNAINVLYQPLERGGFDIEYWNTTEGKIIKKSKATTTTDGYLNINLPSFRGDIALKIKKTY
jgi:hypothetical protein